MPSASATSQRNVGARDALAAGRPRLREPRAARAAPVARGDRRALRGQGARLRARVLDARRRGARGLGRERSLRARTPSSSAPAHIRQVLEEVVGHVERVHEVPPGVDVDEFRPAAARRGARRAARRGPRAIRRTRATASERLPGRGQRARGSASSSRRRADRPLLRQAALQQGRPRAARGAARRSTRGRSIVGFGDYRARARGDRAAAARSSPGRSSTATSSTCSRSRDAVVVPSIFPEAFGMVAAEAAAAGCRRSSHGTPGSQRSPPGWRQAYPPELRRLASFATGDVGRPGATSSTTCWRFRRRAARRSARPPGASQWSAGRGPASQNACSSLSTVGFALQWAKRRSCPYQELLEQARAALRQRHRLHRRGRGGVRAPRPGDARARQPLRGAARRPRPARRSTSTSSAS